MLFETDQKKPVYRNGNSSRSAIQKNATGINRPPVKPVQRSAAATGNSTLQYKPPVRSTAYTQVKKTPAIAPYKPQRKIYNGAPATQVKKTATSPYYKPAITKPFTTTGASRIQPGKIYKYPVAKKPLQSTTGKYSYSRSIKPIRTVAPQKTISRRVYRGPVVMRRAVQIPGRRAYYPGQRVMSPTYRNRVPVRPANVNVSVNTPGGSFVPGYGYCIPQQVPANTTFPASTQQSIPGSTTPVVKKPCHTCGLKTKGCITISRFAFNNSQLKAVHKKQIHELALNIIRKKINTIIATGHTDKIGTENYNEALGARRAGAVVRELRKQLSVLKPNAHKNLFWKILTRGEMQPVSKTDAAANRRVHICVRKMAAA